MRYENEALVSHEKLLTLVSYDKDTGLFTSKVSRCGGAYGKVIGSKNSKGYIVLSVDSCMFKAHVLAWFYSYGSWPTLDIDHINRIKDDNRLCNLREASRQQNLQNVAILKSNTSGYKGVCFNKQANKWQSKTKVTGKLIHLGFFERKEDAGNAYKEYVKALHGEFFAGEDALTNIKK